MSFVNKEECNASVKPIQTTQTKASENSCKIPWNSSGWINMKTVNRSPIMLHSQQKDMVVLITCTDCGYFCFIVKLMTRYGMTNFNHLKKMGVHIFHSKSAVSTFRSIHFQLETRSSERYWEYPILKKKTFTEKTYSVNKHILF